MSGCRILHVVPSLDPADGGPSVAVPLLARAIARRGHHVVILTTRCRQSRRVIGDRLSVIGDPPTPSLRRDKEDGGQKTDRKRPTPNVQRPTLNDRGQRSVVSGQWSVVSEGVEYIFTHRNTQFYKVSWELVRWLRTNIQNFDLVHIHALFSFASTAAAFVAAANEVPYIVRPLGVLNRWGLENRRAILKRGSLALIERRILSRAAAVHYTTEAERAEAARIGSWVTALPSFVTPLPIGTTGLPDYATTGQMSVVGLRPSGAYAPEGGQWSACAQQARGKRVVLFLSRIDPKKGIELLLSAFATVSKEVPDAVLVVAGSGDPDYEAKLHEKAKQLGIDAGVLWAGFLGGEAKAAALDAAEIFVLPSYSENFGIAAAEAFAAGKPCILSDQVGLAHDAQRANAAMVTRCDAGELAEAIKKLLADSARRQALGYAARQFAADRLSMAAVGEQLDEAYRAAITAAKQTSNAQRRTPNAQ